MNPEPPYDSSANASYDDDLPEDAEGPQDRDLDDDSSSDEYEVVPCPYCRREISELAQHCPHCGSWIAPDAGSASRRTPLAIVIAIILLILLLLWVFL